MAKKFETHRERQTAERMRRERINRMRIAERAEVNKQFEFHRKQQHEPLFSPFGVSYFYQAANFQSRDVNALSAETERAGDLGSHGIGRGQQQQQVFNPFNPFKPTGEG